jgi:hypothetical protein
MPFANGRGHFHLSKPATDRLLAASSRLKSYWNKLRQHIFTVRTTFKTKSKNARAA